MPTLDIRKSFEKHLKKIFKKYPKSKKRITKQIEKLAKKPEQGHIYPGFGPLKVRKVRFALPEYKMGKSRGLRLIYLFLVVKDKVIPLSVYAKSGYGSEHEIKALLIERIGELADELE